MDLPCTLSYSRPLFLAPGGELGDLIARFDWSVTSLGPLETWPPVVTTTIGLILRSPLPIVTLWGPDGIMIYNDAYSGFAASRHPELLGSRVREGWPEVADFNDHVMKMVLGEGQTLSYRDQELTLHRNGRAEQVWMNLDYSPIADDSGTSVGVIAFVVETTAKIRAEQRLSGERERLRQMFDEAPGFMALLEGPEHRFAMANRAYDQLVGGRNLIGRTVAEALPEVVDQGFIDLLDRVWNSREPFVARADAVMVNRGGQLDELFVDYVFQPLLSADGGITGIFVQGHDVTEHKRSERLRTAHNEVLELSIGGGSLEEKLEALVRTVERHSSKGLMASILLLDDDGVHLRHGAGPSLPADYNAAIDGVEIGPTVGSCGTAAFTRNAVLVADIANDPLWADFRDLAAAHKLGACWSVPILSGDDQVLGTFAMYHPEPREATPRDLELVNVITRTGALLIERQRAEAALRESEERFRLVAESSPVMLWMSEPDGRCAYLNRAQREFWGLSDEDVGGFDWSTTLHEHDRDALFVPYGEAMRLHKPFTVEARYRRADGVWRVVHTEAQPRLAPGGEFLGMIGVNTDLTEIREAQARLQELNETLEVRVAQEISERRAAEVALQQAQKMESIGKLTGGVAHDFNNLLQIISGNLQLLQAEIGANPQANRRIKNAMAGVERGAKLASQLLAFARRQPLEPKVVNIGRLVAGMEDLLRRSIGEGVEVTTAVSPDLWNTFADPAQLENALLNLSINARDAMEGAGKLTIEVRNADLERGSADGSPEIDPGHYVLLSVSDTGSGIPHDILDHVFEPFFTTKAEGKGSGLGLSMVYGFVKQSGGHVRIDSEVGEGTTVRIYLPRVHEAEDSTNTADVAAAGGGTETILVVEDDDEVRRTVTEMIKDLGYKVLTAPDAASAWPILDSGAKIDLLFTDVVMPGTMRSPDLARMAKQRLPRIAVLFSSGYAQDAIVHGGRLDSGVDLLSKPYTREVLATRIRRALDAAQNEPA